jgi:Acetyltransferase (GNAT) domain
LKKYSYYNPRFTEAAIRLWREQRLLEMFGLRSPEGRLDGVVGCFGRDRVLSAPLVGYDTSLPQKLGLYRMLIALVLRQAARQALTLNLSAGASGFKRLRGGVAHLEYTALFCAHLPPHRRAMWRTLTWLLTEVGARVLQNFEL